MQIRYRCCCRCNRAGGFSSRSGRNRRENTGKRWRAYCDEGWKCVAMPSGDGDMDETNNESELHELRPTTDPPGRHRPGGWQRVFPNRCTGHAGCAKPWTYKTPRLERRAVDKLLAKPSKLVVIDVRRPDELTAKGGFPVYLSIQNKELEKSLAYIPEGPLHSAGVQPRLPRRRGRGCVVGQGLQRWPVPLVRKTTRHKAAPSPASHPPHPQWRRRSDSASVV